MLKLRREKKRGRHRIALMLALAFLAVVVHFSLMNGDTLVETDYRMVRRFLPLLEPIHRAVQQSEYSDFDGRIDASLMNAAAVERLAQGMEDWIHAILFAILSAVFLFAFRKMRMNSIVNVLVTTISCSLYAYYSEVHQMNIHRRGYEWRDVRHNLIGIGIGLCLFVIWLLAQRAVKRGKGRARPRQIAFEYMDSGTGERTRR